MLLYLRIFSEPPAQLVAETLHILRSWSISHSHPFCLCPMNPPLHCADSLIVVLPITADLLMPFPWVPPTPLVTVVDWTFQRRGGLAIASGGCRRVRSLVRTLLQLLRWGVDVEAAGNGWCMYFQDYEPIPTMNCCVVFRIMFV